MDMDDSKRRANDKQHIIGQTDHSIPWNRIGYFSPQEQETFIAVVSADLSVCLRLPPYANANASE